MRCRRAGFECLGFPQMKKMPGAPVSDAPSPAPSYTPTPLAPRGPSQTSAAPRASGAARMQPYPLPHAAPSLPLTSFAPQETPHMFYQSTFPNTQQTRAVSPTVTLSPTNQQANPATNVALLSPVAVSNSSSCVTVGDCLLAARPICDRCLSAIQPFDASASAIQQQQQQPMQAPLPGSEWTGLLPSSTTSANNSAVPSLGPTAYNSFSPVESSMQALVPAPSPSVASSTSAASNRTRNNNANGNHSWPTTKESIVGYYSTIITCWIEGSHPSNVSKSRLFEGIARSLVDKIEQQPFLRLSVASVAACYIGGDQLHWPEDLTLIQRWRAGLRWIRSSYPS